jgi:hypothetical protein
VTLFVVLLPIALIILLQPQACPCTWDPHSHGCCDCLRDHR